MASYRPDGVSIVIAFLTAEHARMSAAFRSPDRRIGDLYFDAYIDGPETESFAELRRAIWEILLTASGSNRPRDRGSR